MQSRRAGVGQRHASGLKVGRIVSVPRLWYMVRPIFLPVDEISAMQVGGCIEKLLQPREAVVFRQRLKAASAFGQQGGEVAAAAVLHDEIEGLGRPHNVIIAGVAGGC